MSMENRWNDRGNKPQVLGEKLAGASIFSS
jgi:hypothetical protein